MTFRLGVGLGVVVSVLFAAQAQAITIPATDLDTWVGGASILPALPDDFVTAAPPPPTNGSVENEVFYDGSVYTYTHEVTPSLNNNLSFNSGGPIAGFTGIAGYSFSQSGAAGGLGTAFDFDIDEIDGTLVWRTNIGSGAGWDIGEPITFFFVSTKSPGIGDYNLTSSEVGTAQSYAPVPEPGSIALLGSGLVALYTAVRRRQLKA